MKIKPYKGLKLIRTDAYGELYAGHDADTREPALIRVYTMSREAHDRLRDGGHKDPQKILEARIKAAINQAETLSGGRYFPEVAGTGFAGGFEWIAYKNLPATLEMELGPDTPLPEADATRFGLHTAPQRLDMERALYLGGQLLDALQELHSFRRMHRGLTPGAIALSPDGDIKLIDLGHAPLVSAHPNTADQALFPYLPNDMHAPGGRIDIKAEIYAAGAIIRRMIMGADWQSDPPPQDLLDAYGPDFFDIVNKAQGRAGGARYIQAAEMVADYEAEVVEWEQRTDLSVAAGRREITLDGPDETDLPDELDADSPDKLTISRTKDEAEPEDALISSLGLSTDNKTNTFTLSPKIVAACAGGIVFIGLIIGLLLLGNRELSPDDIAFREATDIGTREAVEAYLEAWPEGENNSRAERFLARLDEDENDARTAEERAADDAAWIAATTAGSNEALEDYLDAYPEGRHRDDAEGRLERNAFREALGADDFAAIEQFMADYPTTRFRSDLDDKSWLIAKDAANLDALDKYLRLYPGGAHEEEAEALRTQIQNRLDREQRKEDDRFWLLAQTADSESAYEEYLESQPAGRYRVEAEEARYLLEQERLIAEARARLVRAHQVEFRRLGYLNISLNGREDRATKKAMQSFATWTGAPEPLPIGQELLRQLRDTASKPLPVPLTRFQDCTNCPEMLVLPAGAFQMGSAAAEIGRTDSEGPVQAITLPVPFAIGFTEVTREQWRACVSAGVCANLNLNGVNFEEDITPMTEIPFEQAERYAEWLSRETGYTYRLPTEAEWEYAARAGTGTAFSFGSSYRAACSHANTDDLAEPPAGAGWIMQPCQDGQAGVAAVGSLTPNGYGLFDMHGNAAEWTSDCWDNGLSSKPKDGTPYRLPGTRTCSLRVVKGGSYLTSTADARSAARRPLNADGNGSLINGVGIRVVRDLTS